MRGRRGACLLAILGTLCVGCGGSSGSSHQRDAGVQFLPAPPPTPGDSGFFTLGCLDIPSEPATGGDCVRDADCAGDAVCGLATSPAPVDDARAVLTCGARASGAPPGSACEVGADCDRGMCVVAGTCVAACATDADCGADDWCRPVHIEPTSATTARAYACVPRFTLPADVQVEAETDLTMAIAGPSGSVDGQLSPTTVDFPGGDGLYIAEAGCDATAIAYALETKDAPPVKLFDLLALTSGDTSDRLNPIGVIGSPSTLLIPNGPLSTPSDAGYTVSFAVDERTPVQLHVLRGVRDGGKLDLDLFYVGAAGLAPTRGTPPPAIAQALETFRRIYAHAGIEVGQVRQHVVRGVLALRLGRITGSADQGFPGLPELYSLSAGAPGPSVSVFLADAIDDVAGISGGVPGPLGENATGISGVAISTQIHIANGFDLGETMAHEVGHYLGLFHTTESGGEVLEALPDTPECPASRDANRDGLLSVTECVGFGADNLMFWQLSPNQERLTPDQLHVLAGALILTKP